MEAALARRSLRLWRTNRYVPGCRMLCSRPLSIQKKACLITLLFKRRAPEVPVGLSASVGATVQDWRFPGRRDETLRSGVWGLRHWVKMLWGGKQWGSLCSCLGESLGKEDARERLGVPREPSNSPSERGRTLHQTRWEKAPKTQVNFMSRQTILSAREIQSLAQNNAHCFLNFKIFYDKIISL